MRMPNRISDYGYIVKDHHKVRRCSYWFMYGYSFRRKDVDICTMIHPLFFDKWDEAVGIEYESNPGQKKYSISLRSRSGIQAYGDMAETLHDREIIHRIPYEKVDYLDTKNMGDDGCFTYTYEDVIFLYFPEELFNALYIQIMVGSRGE